MIKAYPGLATIGTADFGFTTGPTVPSTLQSPTANVSSASVFWAGFDLYIAFAKKIVDTGGFGHGDVAPLGNGSLSFSGSFLMPGLSANETAAFIAPLFNALRTSAGVNITTPIPRVVSHAEPATGVGAGPGSNTFGSRLLPRSSWSGAASLRELTGALRAAVEAGFSVRTRAYAPTLEAAGHPGRTAAVNPAMRDMVAHLTVFSPAVITSLTGAQLPAALADLDAAVEMIRRVTPGSGAYLNEAARLEPNWQQSFFGANYQRLLRIKREVDPWGLFWAPGTVGSEAWRVETEDGTPTNNGPLCKMGE